MRAAHISLLCLPCAGASAILYLRWRGLLPEWIRVEPVELPGRGSRLAEALIEDFDQLVEHICMEQAQALEGRYALFGHSMGALLAYGVAQRQRQRSLAMPRALFVSASSAPSRRDPARFANKGDDASLIADLRKQGGTPEAVFASSELLRMTLDALRADYRACASFRYAASEPLAVPVHVFGGRDDDIDAGQLEAWRREAGGAFSLDWFSGGHFFLRQQEQAVLTAVVRDLLHPYSGAERAAIAAA